MMQQHASYRGFRALAVAAGARGPDGRPGRTGRPGQIIAFSYGFSGAQGQWWHDVVAAALTATTGPAGAPARAAGSPGTPAVRAHPALPPHRTRRRPGRGLPRPRPGATAGV